jgi:acetoin:2,6-dichlorophenolindophenol oxidoreductase subunit alpha
VNSDEARLKSLYRQMLVIRRAEERLQRLFADGEVPGFLHLSIGQEAVAAGVSAALRASDTVSSNHRGHGHALAKGVSLDGFFAEIMGRETGVCRGRGGSMHVADLSIGMLGANGIVGAGLPITTGSALALKIQGEGNIAVVYFGDGALAEGVVHECFNMTALWSLPVLFVCENNGWSEFSPIERQLATKLEALASAFGISHTEVDGNDVVAVADAAAGIVAQMRTKPEPYVLECRTTRVRGHFEGDKQDYRDAGEIEALSDRDPIAAARKKLAVQGVEAQSIDQLLTEIDEKIEAAVNAARAAAEPQVSSITADVYTPVAGAV